MVLTLCATAFAAVEPQAAGSYTDGVWKYDEPVDVPAYMAYNPTRSPEPDKMWLYEYARREMNINFQFTYFDEDTVGDQAPLMMASGDYPAAFLYFQYFFSAIADQTEYGDVEKILIPLQDYLNSPDIMPNLSRYMVEYAADIPFVSTLAGNIYNVPYVLQNPDYSVNASFQPLWYDTRVLDALGVSEPKTAEDLLAILRLVKEKDPKGLGSNNIPLGGKTKGPFLHAFGFASSDENAVWSLRGVKAHETFRDGEIVALQTHPDFLKYLQYMNTLFSEELIDTEIYTMETSEETARAQANYYTFWTTYNALTWTEEDFPFYNQLPPLTSASNSEQIARINASQMTSQYMFFVTNKATPLQAEAVMRFADWCSDPKYTYLAYYGPEYGVNDGYGLLDGWYIGEDGTTYKFKDVDEGKFDGDANYKANVGTIYFTGNVLYRPTDGSVTANFNPLTRSGRMGYEMMRTYNPYWVRGLPSALYPEDIQIQMTDLGQVLAPYINTEVARFVTGARQPSEEEFAKYGAELEAMGYSDYLQTFVDNIKTRFGLE